MNVLINRLINSATQITVFLGSISLTAVDPNRLVVVTTSYTIYPTYDPITLENDVALINLLQPVAISGNYNQILIRNN